MAFTLIVDSETIAQANAASTFLWDVPEDAHVKGDHNKDGGTATWSEIVEVTSSSVEEDEQEKGTALVKVGVTVPADVTSSNVGKPALVLWMRVTPAAFRDKNHAKYKRNSFAIGRLNSLLRAVGFDIPKGESVNYTEFFGGETPTVVGNRVTAYLKKSWYEGKPRTEVTDFQSLAESTV